MWWTKDDDYNIWFKNQKALNEGNFNGGSRPRSQKNRRSSSGKGKRPKSQLSLEKKFCLVVGGVSWKKLLDTQKYMHQDEKVMQWKDSAVEEAYWNAKKRFLAKALGQPCDTNLPDPDPDIFIDEIDWDSNVDSSLMLELDNRDPGETDQKDRGVVVGIPVVPEQYINTPSGWGDDEQFKIPERYDNDWHGYDKWDENGVNNADIGWSNEQFKIPERCDNNWHEYGNWGESGVNNADIDWLDEPFKLQERCDSSWNKFFNWGENGVNNADIGWSNEQSKLQERFDSNWYEYNYWGENGVNDADIGWSYEQSKLQERFYSNWHEYNNWGENGVNNADIGWSNGWEDDFFYTTYQYHEENRLGNGGPTGNKQGDHGYNKKPSYGGRNTERCKNFKDQSSIDDYGNKKRGNFSNKERHAVVKWRPVSRQC